LAAGAEGAVVAEGAAGGSVRVTAGSDVAVAGTVVCVDDTAVFAAGTAVWGAGTAVCVGTLVAVAGTRVFVGGTVCVGTLVAVAGTRVAVGGTVWVAAVVLVAFTRALAPGTGLDEDPEEGCSPVTWPAPPRGLLPVCSDGELVVLATMFALTEITGKSTSRMTAKYTKLINLRKGNLICRLRITSATLLSARPAFQPMNRQHGFCRFHHLLPETQVTTYRFRFIAP
jgi:hypothetical protein